MERDTADDTADDSGLMQTMTRPLGIILAGGTGQRMGGLDKATLPLGSATLLDHAIARLAPQCAALAINANRAADALAQYGLPVLPDPVLPDHAPEQAASQMGPLAGILAGMDWAAAQGASQIVTVAVDTPFFPRDLVARLQAARAPSGLCLAASPDMLGQMQRHPTFGLWPVALRHDLRSALAGGMRKLRAFADQHGAAQAVFAATPPAAPCDPFFNINRPADLVQAQTMLHSD